MQLTVGFSTCPNDTFMFDAMVHHKIDTEGLKFEVLHADVEQLNHWALAGKLDVSKVSFNAFTQCVNKYALLDSGAALGRNCGPLLVKKPNTVLSERSIIAIPGNNTTANMLLAIAFPTYTNKKEVVFSEIEEKILNEEVDAGLIIHENRFTYKDKGLKKVIDLGEFWESKTKLAIPLGGIVVNRDLLIETQKKLEKILRKSVEYAFVNPKSSADYVRSNAQEMDPKVIKAHISLYVNDFSITLGEEGRSAVEKIFQFKGLTSQSIFV